MLTREKKVEREQIEMLCIEDLVPKNHILREIDEAISFDFIYDEVKELYSENNGRPSVDPVVLFKIIIIKYIFGIRSIRQTIKEIEVNMAYRWFLGYTMTEKIPHFTTFGKNYERRFAESDIFEKIELMEEINRDREAHGKKPFCDKDDDDDNSPPAEKNIKKSTTDPECGVFHKGEHEKMFAYTAHTACVNVRYKMNKSGN